MNDFELERMLEELDQRLVSGGATTEQYLQAASFVVQMATIGCDGRWLTSADRWKIIENAKDCLDIMGELADETEAEIAALDELDAAAGSYNPATNHAWQGIWEGIQREEAAARRRNEPIQSDAID
jgi:hypothetical protein